MESHGMRLNKIKLAGFKSFVDPTTINFPGKISCVVGPNGCGKSNVIDAVRWVMGESSAKHLRGDSMADVIFNGSGSRKPVGQATIELVFDNSDGSAGGQYAGFSEISVRRQVSRDGASAYFLNGTRCRRRDITDVFLGTGLGPRSYAIIEQGMITRLIEARPEELRVLLEEAAGISKYKERRRDTENRIRHTRENLERLSDLRDELEKQLSHLKSQARTAEKYKTLSEQQRELEAQLMALHWRELEQEASGMIRALREQENAAEKALADQRAAETELEKARQNQTEANHHFQQEQQAYYKAGAEVARLEQTIAHARDLRQRQQHELEQIEHSLGEIDQRVASDEERIGEAERVLAELEPARERASEAITRSDATLAELEAKLRAWQGDWEQHNRALGECRQAVEVEQARLQQLEKQQGDLVQRQQRLTEEQEALGGSQANSEIETAREAREQARQSVDQAQQQLDEYGQRLEALRAEQGEQHESLQQQQGELQEVSGRLASLRALQQSAADESVTREWLTQQGLDQAPRLARELKVEAGWERAVEIVLGAQLDALYVDSLDALVDAASRFEGETLALVEPGDSKAASDKGSLAARVTGNARVAPLLGGVLTAEDAASALAMRADLAPGQSVITPEGLWLGPNWLRLTRETDPQAGVLAREQEIRELEAREQQLQQAVDKALVARDELREQIREAETAREAARREHNEAHRQLSDAGARLQTLEGRAQHNRQRMEAIGRERDELEKRAGELNEQIHSARAHLETQLEKLPALEAISRDRHTDREQIAGELDQARQRQREDRDHCHQLDLKLQGQRSLIEAARERVNQLRRQKEQMSERREELKRQHSDEKDPEAEHQKELKQLLDEQVAAEKRLGEARQRLQDIEQQLRELDERRLVCERESRELQGELETRRLRSSEVRVRQETVQERINETGYKLQALLEQLADDAEASRWEADLKTLSEKIQRLGPINLAAIDEYTTQSERKNYLDQQDADLTEALETLESAIRKIDRETRTRFKETFDKVNTTLQATFPRLFGGGHAYLELTGDDLLDTGVTIMARPPGKRNSSIHQLSGGEKALTAVALVFAIFELNPAPFCMLDEVDAPLDDANVGRFCQLVAEMSERVQFIVITHNKNTMEMADYLLGVTMSEPGVSRQVSVDVEEAAQMASM